MSSKEKLMLNIPINLEADFVNGELCIPRFISQVKALIIFAHGSGSGKNSPRNQFIADVLNQNGFATLLMDLLSLSEQESDLKSQKIMDKYPHIVLNKFNISLLSRRLSIITKWVIKYKPELKDLSIGYFGSSTGAAAAIEASTDTDLSDKIYAIVSKGGRPDLSKSDIFQKVRSSTLLIVGEKDHKKVIELNKKAFKQLKNTKHKELVSIPNGGHLLDEEGVLDKVIEYTIRWYNNSLK